MTQLLGIFSFLAVLLRGLALAFEALTIGGVIFLIFIAPATDGELSKLLSRWVRCYAALLAVAQVCSVTTSSAILIGSTDLKLRDLVDSQFWIAGILTVTGALLIIAVMRTKQWQIICAIASLSILTGSTMISHSFGRLEYRCNLMGLTLLHHLASAAWIGGLPYLLVALRHTPQGVYAASISSRFSRMAVASVVLISSAGAALAFSYVGLAAAIFETTYGVMLLAKVILTGLLLMLGALNFRIVRSVRRGAVPDMLPLRRFAEAEIGIGFTVFLAAASLTSTPPAVDVLADRVPAGEIAERMTPRWPRMDTPSVAELSPASPLVNTESSTLPGSFVPGQLRHPNTPADIAWSEYNHHWAGLIMLGVGLLALLSRSRYFGWARNWPLVFLSLAVFLLIRADSENWPLGPNGFWESFQEAEVAQHRLFVLLIVAFAVFEWGVQTRRIAPKLAALVFPFVCASGGALLLTHSHSLGNLKEEFLAELSHIPLAILGVIAGWSRWLELRLPQDRKRILAWIWPVCFVLVGAVLLSYRES